MTVRYPPGCQLAQVFTEEPGHFASMHAAEAWLSERGLEVGSTQRGNPTAVYWKDQWGGGSSKWNHIEADSIEILPGYLEGDNRDGPLRLYLTAVTGVQLDLPLPLELAE